MISRRVKVQLVVFVLLSVGGIVYTGLRYVGFNLVTHPYKVTAYFTKSGGIFTNAAVTNRGVVVGRVGSLHLTKDGVAVDLLLRDGTHVPADTKAVVANLSAVGEQYVDLQPQRQGPPYLHAGSTIPASRTGTPIDDATLLRNFDELARSVDVRNLGIDIEELGKGFQGTGPALQALIDQGNKLTDAAQAALPQTVKLINDGKTVLDTQRATSGDLKTFAANLEQLSAQIVRSDPDIRRLFDTGVASADELKALIDENRTALPVLLDNLVTLGRIQEARLPGLETTLIIYPANVANGFLAAAGGIAHFGLVTTSSPGPCTQGYGSTHKRTNNQDGQHPQDWGGPANLQTYCTQPAQGPSDVRGARNAPRPAGDTTGSPPYRSGSGTTTAQSAPSTSHAPSPMFIGQDQSAGSGSVVLTPYDPFSGLLRAPDGRVFQLGETGGQQQVLGAASWEWLLLSPAAS